jgi:hypothetical protein
MASCKLLTWHGSKGVGAPVAPDGVYVDRWYMGSTASVPINNAEIILTTSSWVLIKYGTVGVTNELETITGGTSGAIIFVTNSGANITIKDQVGNIKLAGGVDFYMAFGSTHCTLTLFFDGTNWLEMGRATDVN